MQKLRISKARDVKTPERGTPGSAGLDFFLPQRYGDQVEILPGQDVLLSSGVKVDIPKGYALIAFNKSGVAVKQKLIVGAQVIDEDYQGVIHIHLINTGSERVYLKPEQKIAQFVLLPVAYPEPEVVPIDELFTESSERGEGGFGSTGDV